MLELSEYILELLEDMLERSEYMLERSDDILEWTEDMLEWETNTPGRHAVPSTAKNMLGHFVIDSHTRWESEESLWLLVWAHMSPGYQVLTLCGRPLVWNVCVLMYCLKHKMSGQWLYTSNLFWTLDANWLVMQKTDLPGTKLAFRKTDTV